MKPTYKTILVKGHIHVVRQYQRGGVMRVKDSTEPVPESNYLGIKNLMLCGVLKKGETLDQWRTAKEHRMAQRQLFD